MGDSVLEVHQNISDGKSTIVVFKFHILRGNSHKYINTIENRLTKQIYLSWGQNALEE